MLAQHLGDRAQGRAAVLLRFPAVRYPQRLQDVFLVQTYQPVIQTGAAVTRDLRPRCGRGPRVFSAVFGLDEREPDRRGHLISCRFVIRSGSRSGAAASHATSRSTMYPCSRNSFEALHGPQRIGYSPIARFRSSAVMLVVVGRRSSSSVEHDHPARTTTALRPTHPATPPSDPSASRVAPAPNSPTTPPPPAVPQPPRT
jgi:hypothetical protein